MKHNGFYTGPVSLPGEGLTGLASCGMSRGSRQCRWSDGGGSGRYDSRVSVGPIVSFPEFSARYPGLQRHLRAIFYVSLLRVLAELALGTWITLVALVWDSENGPRFLTYHYTARPESGDREAFFILGVGLMLLGMIRLAQVLGSARRLCWARSLGLGLGWLDFLTPLTLPLGLWALLVYRHPDTRQLFRRGLSEGASSLPGEDSAGDDESAG